MVKALGSIALLLAACAPATPADFECSGSTMGTTWTLRTQNKPPEARPIQERLDELEGIFSTWREDSEISRFNRFPLGEPFPASRHLLALTETAARFHASSNGALDPTVGPLVASFGFGPPSMADPLAVPCFAAIERSIAQGTLRKTKAAATLDLSALVEGYALDIIGEDLKKAGYSNFLLEIGGELLAHGPGPQGQGWTVGVQDPGRARGVPLRRIALRNEALATSGTYIQQDGQNNHLIDPRTRRPIAHDTVSVSVVAPDATTADGWATALMILGEADGRALADREGLQALFLRRPVPRKSP
jgi:FAD:protein FMN transferase